MEDSEMDTIPMNDIVVYKIDKNIEQNTGAKFLKARLINTKKQVMWSCRILFSLLRYVCKDETSYFAHFIICYRDRVTFGAVLLQGLYAFGVIGFEECFSLWSATSRSLGWCNTHTYTHTHTHTL